MREKILKELHAKKLACEDEQVRLSSAFLGRLRASHGRDRETGRSYLPPETIPSPGALNVLLRERVFGDRS